MRRDGPDAAVCHPMKRRSLRSRIRRRAIALERRVVLGRVVSVPSLGLEKIGSGYGGWIVPTVVHRQPTGSATAAGSGRTSPSTSASSSGSAARSSRSTRRRGRSPTSPSTPRDEPRFTFRPVGLWSEDTTPAVLRATRPGPRLPLGRQPAAHGDLLRGDVRSLPTPHARARPRPDRPAQARHRGCRTRRHPRRSSRPASARPSFCLEIDQPVRPWTFWRTVRRIRSAGYTLVAVDGWNLTFIRRRRARAAAPRRPRRERGCHVPGPPAGHVRDHRPRRRAVHRRTPCARSTRSRTRSSSSRARRRGPEHRDAPTATRATGRSRRSAPVQGRRGSRRQGHHRHRRGRRPPRRLLARREGRAEPRLRAPGDRRLPVAGRHRRVLPRRGDGAGPGDARRRPADRRDDVPPDHLLGRPRLRLRRLVPPPRRGRLPPAVPLGPGLRRTRRTGPPTVLDETGRDLRTGRWLDADATAAAGVHLYHYSLLLPKQVIEKCDYYANADWARRTGAIEWANEACLSLHRPFRVHNVYRPPELARALPRAAPRSRCDRMVDGAAAGRRPDRAAAAPTTSSACWTRPGTGSVVPSSSGWTRGTSARAVVGRPGAARRRKRPVRFVRRGAPHGPPRGPIGPAMTDEPSVGHAGDEVRPGRWRGADRVTTSRRPGRRGHASWMATVRESGLTIRRS